MAGLHKELITMKRALKTRPARFLMKSARIVLSKFLKQCIASRDASRIYTTRTLVR